MADGHFPSSSRQERGESTTCLQLEEELIVSFDHRRNRLGSFAARLGLLVALGCVLAGLSASSSPAGEFPRAPELRDSLDRESSSSLDKNDQVGPLGKVGSEVEENTTAREEARDTGTERHAVRCLKLYGDVGTGTMPVCYGAPSTC